MEFWLAEENTIFATSIGLMLLIAVFEGALAIIGFGFSHLLDSLFPRIEFDAEIEVGQQGGLSQFLGWINFGRVPMLVLLIAFLTSFGLAGYFMQGMVNSLFARLLPGWLIAIPAFVICLPVVRFLTSLLGKFITRDETQAISTSQFIGNVATVTVGEARKGFPAEARFKDEFGTTHYIMVEPDDDHAVFQKGEQVLITEQRGNIFRVITLNNSNLL